MKIVPPNGIGDQKLWRTCCDLDHKTGVFFGTRLKLVRETDWIWMKTFLFFFFFFFFFGRPPNFRRKNRFNFSEDLFLEGDYLILDKKNGFNFSEDLFFSFWRSPHFGRKNRPKLIKDRLNSGLRSFALFSSIQNSPPPQSKFLATRLVSTKIYVRNWPCHNVCNWLWNYVIEQGCGRAY